MNRKTLPALQIILCLVLCCLFFACAEKKTPGASEKQLVEWYNKVADNKFILKDSMEQYANLLVLHAQGKGNDYKAMGQISMGIFRLYKSEYYSSLNHYNKALALLKNSSNDTLLTRVYAGIGNHYKNTGEAAPALENLFTALKIAERRQYLKYAAGIHSAIAQVYQVKGDFNNATFHINESLQLLKDQSSSTAYLVSVHTLANIYGEKGKLDSALMIDKIGIEICERMNILDLKSTFYDNKANCFMYSNQFDSALYYFKECIKIDSALGEKKQVSDTYYNLGNMAFMQKNFLLAEQQLKKSIELTLEAGYKTGRQNGWQLLAEVYKNSGRLNLSITAKDSAIKIKDEILNFKTQARIAELKTVYETEKKEQQIREQEFTISKRNYTIGAISIFLILGGMLGYSYVRRFRLSKDQELQKALMHQQEKATIAVLTAEEKERKRIASDLHDGVGQLMTAAWLNLQALKNEMEQQATIPTNELLTKAMLLVDESCKEVRQVSHNMMPNALVKKGLVNAVQEFIQQIGNRSLAINLQTDGLQDSIATSVEVVLYRVIQESVNNVVKHAKASQLDISINQDDVGIDVLIEDNGLGFDKTLAAQKDGIGLENIQSRILYLKGTVDWNTAPGKGTLVMIHIPKHGKQQTD